MSGGIQQWLKLSEISVQLVAGGWVPGRARTEGRRQDGGGKEREREAVDNFGSRATKHRGRPFA